MRHARDACYAEQLVESLADSRHSDHPPVARQNSISSGGQPHALEKLVHRFDALVHEIACQRFEVVTRDRH